MFNLFQIKKYSLNTKVILSFLIFILTFIIIRFSLVIPKVKEEAYQNEINNITRILSFIKEQARGTSYAIRMQTKVEVELLQEKIKIEIERLKSIKQNEEILENINHSDFSKYCGYKLSNKDFNYKKIKEIDLFNKNNLDILDQWQTYTRDDLFRGYNRKKTYFFYNTKLNPNLTLSLGCEPNTLNQVHQKFKKLLKKHLHKNFSLLQSINNAKIMFVWVNPNIKYDDSRPLYEENKELIKERYSISYLSNVNNITTGNLTTKEILEIKNKKPIEHIVDSQKKITWVLDIEIPDKDELFIFIYTINKNDLLKKTSSNLFILLPETLTAIFIALILILFVFRRSFKNINKLTQTALKVNQGNKNIRSNVKGEDDIGILGEAFDSMLNFFENNIKILDSKIEEKTKELKKSLNEKETLLEEIHHRVKNNLAKTITLIELQEKDVKDKNTKKALVDIKERIYTMELLHRKLYESSDLNEISFKEYSKDLLDAIFIAYNMEKRLEVNYNIQDIKLNIETAMPLGLIINELVTNAIKYAFMNNNNPKLYIEITKKQKQIFMIIKDNGKGLKQEFLNNSKTLGLKLINTIVKFQLSGSIDYIYEEGAKFTIKAKTKEPL